MVLFWATLTLLEDVRDVGGPHTNDIPRCLEQPVQVLDIQIKVPSPGSSMEASQASQMRYQLASPQLLESTSSDTPVMPPCWSLATALAHLAETLDVLPLGVGQLAPLVGTAGKARRSEVLGRLRCPEAAAAKNDNNVCGCSAGCYIQALDVVAHRATTSETRLQCSTGAANKCCICKCRGHSSARKWQGLQCCAGAADERHTHSVTTPHL